MLACKCRCGRSSARSRRTLSSGCSRVPSLGASSVHVAGASSASVARRKRTRRRRSPLKTTSPSAAFVVRVAAAVSVIQATSSLMVLLLARDEQVSLIRSKNSYKATINNSTIVISFFAVSCCFAVISLSLCQLVDSQPFLLVSCLASFDVLHHSRFECFS